MSRYQLTAQAVNDLREIVAWLAEHLGEDVAVRTEDELFEKFELLADFPGLGSQRTDLTRHPFHFFLHAPYFIVYTRRTDPLMIHGILHTARDLKRILRGRKP